MPPLRKLTDDQVALIAEKLEGGRVTGGMLARDLNVSRGTIAWHALKLGVINPRGRLGNRGPMVMTRGNHQVRKFTPEDDAKLLALAMAVPRPTNQEIGRQLGRAHNSIKARLMTLARREESEAA